MKSHDEKPKTLRSEAMKTHGKALDGGWGWMVALSAHLMHFLTGGLDRASGVFYREILEEMQLSSASTAGFAALLFSSKCLVGPLTSVLCKYFGCRSVTMAGGIISFLGLLLSSFCHSLLLIYLTLGLMTGVGNGLAYTAGLLALNDYFCKRKATALGLATAGTGIGSFVLPLLTHLLIRVYSFRGCMLILSALSLNLLVCGALLYPLPVPQDESTALCRSEKNEVKAETLEKSAQSSMPNGRNELIDDEDNNSALSDDLEEETSEKQSLLCKSADSGPERPSACREFFAQLLENLDLHLFLNWQFSMFTVATFFISAGFKPVAVIVPHYAELMGLTETTSVLLISISGAFDTVSRFAFGLFFDTKCLVPYRRRIWSLGMLLTAASIAAYSLANSLIPFMIVSAAFGLTSGLFMSQLYCVLTDLIGRENCRTGIGLLVLCRGVGVAIGPPLAGGIHDITGSYKLSFCVLGFSTFIGFVCLCVLDVAIMLINSRRRQESSEQG